MPFVPTLISQFIPGGRIQRSRHTLSRYVDPVTLRPFSSRTTSDMNIIVRVDDVEERFEGDLSPSNVRTASTLTLLRKRARTIRTFYNRYWESLQVIEPQPSDYESFERNGDVHSRIKNLKWYITPLALRTEELDSQIRRSASASERLECRMAIDSPQEGRLVAMNESFIHELERRDKTVQRPLIINYKLGRRSSSCVPGWTRAWSSTYSTRTRSGWA